MILEIVIIVMMKESCCSLSPSVLFFIYFFVSVWPFWCWRWKSRTHLQTLSQIIFQSKIIVEWFCRGQLKSWPNVKFYNMENYKYPSFWAYYHFVWDLNLCLGFTKNCKYLSLWPYCHFVSHLNLCLGLKILFS